MQQNDYSKTIHLPQTSFPMKGNLPVREPELLEFWKRESVYQEMLKNNEGNQKFILPDGPPYANGSIHIGHTLNKILKDMIIKYRNLSGYYAAFIPGWDCHGLPIEHAVTQALNSSQPILASEVRSLCRAEAQKWIDHQKTQFQRLGVFGDWDRPYKTMDPTYEAEIVRGFALLFERGYIYRSNKPVYWNTKLQTALADAEVEYHNKKSPSIYVEFAVDSSNLSKRPFKVLIWTTTPWTLPANLGICLHPEVDYGLYESVNSKDQPELYLIAKGRAEALAKEVGRPLTWVQDISSRALEREVARHPFYEREALFVLGEHVTLDAGTGCVHTAPGHGPEDYKVGLRYGLPALSPVGPDGRFTKEAPGFEGKLIWDANEEIIRLLSSKGALFHQLTIEHTYPHCWRSKYPLIYRATPQWFLGLDIPERPLRDTLIKKVSELNFVPEWGRARFLGMLENRPDWCLSRQRIWGVPVPVLICKKTGEPIADVKIMRRIADVIESEGGIEAFYSRPAESFLGDWKPANSEIGSQGFLHSQDILDVWMDSGMCHTAVQKRRPELDFPADIYLEGSDQHRGWFNSSFLSSIACYDEAPYKSLVTHGFVQQSKGIKMSKSKGNAADPIRFCEQTGADILRLWVAHEDFGKDVIWGEDLIDRVKETYRRARNTLRYLLGNLEGSPRKAIEVNRLHPLDAWALHRHQEVIGKVKNAFDQYEFYRVYHLLNQYMTVELSALYFDVLKDRLYTGAKEGALRQSSITVLRLILDDLLVMLAPILSFLAEEAYQSDPQRQKKSVFLERFPIAHQKFLQPELATEFDALLALKEAVQKKLELKRAEKLIGSSLEAHVNFELSESWLESSIACRSQEFLTKSQRPNSDSEKEISKAALKEFLREFFIVSSVEIRWTREPVQNVDVFNIEVSKALGEKCPRCWVISPCLSSSTQFPGVCPKCVDHLSE